MKMVRNKSAGIYADGALFVHPGEVVEVSDAQADYLCDKDTAGTFELLPSRAAVKPEQKK